MDGQAAEGEVVGETHRRPVPTTVAVEEAPNEHPSCVHSQGVWWEVPLARRPPRRSTVTEGGLEEGMLSPTALAWDATTRVVASVRPLGSKEGF